MKYVDRFRVLPGSNVKLAEIDSGFTDHHESHKKAADEVAHLVKKLRKLQDLFHADGRRSLLICLQGMDTGGKDGTIHHFLAAMDPQGCDVVQFRQPSNEELAHDFLWRIHKAAPPKGGVTIFNRSHSSLRASHSVTWFAMSSLVGSRSAAACSAISSPGGSPCACNQSP